MKYIFYGPQFKPAYAMFKEIFERSDVKYVSFSFSSYSLIRKYYAYKILRPLIIYYISRLKIDKNEPLAFVYYEPWDSFMAKSGCLSLFRKKYKNSIHVALLYDVILAKKIDMECLKNMYDEVYIYDKEAAKEFGITFFPPCYSKNFETPSEESEIYDVSFVGHAKNRLPEIIKVYEKLTAIGLKCKFYIVGAEESTQKYKEGIVYESKYLSEEAYFHSYIEPSKCLLEIANKGTDALTARVREAVMYDKKIISNNQNLKKYKYYNEDMMQVYENIEDINVNFLRDLKDHIIMRGIFHRF